MLERGKAMKFKKKARTVKHIIQAKIFNLNGKKPWSYGYNAYREQEILSALRNNPFKGNQDLYNGYGLRIDERIIEYPWLFSRLPLESGILLDAGSVLNFDYILEQEALAKKQVYISTLTPEGNCYWGKGISYIYEDLRNVCYKDNYFDWIVSMSTIEHIGMDNTLIYTTDHTKKESAPDSYLTAIREFKRILKPGGSLYLTFPYGTYCNFGWFQVFNSQMLDNLTEAFGPASMSESHFRYEPEGWVPSTRNNSNHLMYFDINQNSGYDYDYAAAARAVVCLEMVK
jgi:SAM-dependent methyltransferase